MLSNVWLGRKRKPLCYWYSYPPGSKSGDQSIGSIFCAAVGYFSTLTRLYFLKTKRKSQIGWGAGEVSKQSSERWCARDRNFRNNSPFHLSNKLSKWHQKQKSSAVRCRSITFHAALGRAHLFAPCSPYESRYHTLAGPTARATATPSQPASRWGCAPAGSSPPAHPWPWLSQSPASPQVWRADAKQGKVPRLLERCTVLLGSRNPGLTAN